MPPHARTQERFSAKQGLPVKAFFYTLDQIAAMLGLDQSTFENEYVFFTNRTTGIARGLMRAVNIQPDPSKEPDWRIVEDEFVRWLRFKGFRVSNGSVYIG